MAREKEMLREKSPLPNVKVEGKYSDTYSHAGNSENSGSHKRNHNRNRLDTNKRHKHESEHREKNERKHKTSNRDRPTDFNTIRVKEEPVDSEIARRNIKDEFESHHPDRRSRSHHSANLPMDNIRVKREHSRETDVIDRHQHRHGEHHRPNASRDEDRQHRREDRQSFNQPRDIGSVSKSNDGGIESKSKDVKEREKPNLKLTGKLAEESNTFRGVVIKYNEPDESRKPKTRWRLYGFKGDKELPMLPIHRQSAYLLGRDRIVADIPIDHPSCSKQHAVLQYRLVKYERADGTTGHRVRPYIIDLESSNGTFLNSKQIEAKRFVELKERDVIKFGFSSREYVILHENSKDDELADEDVGVDLESQAR